MHGFYEYNQDKLNKVSVHIGKWFLFPAHFHHRLEIFILKKGETTISCNGKSYQLSDGDIAFFNSYDLHSFDAQHQPIDAYCIIAPTELAPRFIERIKNKSIKSPVIKDSVLCNELYEFTKKYFLSQDDENIKTACLEFMLSLLEQRFEFIAEPRDNETTELVKKVLMYINDNFKQDVSLKTISKKLGYSNAHISRAFTKHVKKSIPNYVNELRYKEVKRLIKETDQNITELIFLAGFNSLQTYYRYKSKALKNQYND